MTKMRAKLVLQSVENGFDVNGAVVSNKLGFNAVAAPRYSPEGRDEDNTFALYTPQAYLTMTVNNPDLVGKFAVGDRFYVDFTPVPAEGAHTPKKKEKADG